MPRFNSPSTPTDRAPRHDVHQKRPNPQLVVPDRRQVDPALRAAHVARSNDPLQRQRRVPVPYQDPERALLADELVLIAASGVRPGLSFSHWHAQRGHQRHALLRGKLQRAGHDEWVAIVLAHRRWSGTIRGRVGRLGHERLQRVRQLRDHVRHLQARPCGTLLVQQLQLLFEIEWRCQATDEVQQTQADHSAGELCYYKVQVLKV